MENLTAKVQENKTVLLCLVCFLAGLALGFVISPAKNGIVVGSYNGSNNKVTDSNKLTDSNKITDSNKTKKIK